MPEYEAVIGLETHIQLNTASKIFCACKADSWDDAPNSNICPVCTGLPGVLPVLNQAAVDKAALLAAAMGAFLGVWKILLVFVLSAAIGLAISLVVMAFSASLRKHRIIPFGPSLALAAVVAGFWGQEIIRFYLAHFAGR